MSLWRRLRGAFAPSPPPSPPKPRGSVPPPEEDDAQRILTYARRIGPLDERPERCDGEILAALTRLWQSGPKAQAITLGGTLASALPHDARLQLTVAEFLCMQRDYGPAVPLLERTLAATGVSREERLRARFVLHEAAIAENRVAAAVTHLTHLLAEDFSYPGARTRLTTLRAQVGQTAPLGTLGKPTGPPLAKAPEAPQSGLFAPAAPTLIGLPSGPGARYQLLRELGCGSAGTVYLALDSELGCEVALKVFHPRRRDTAGGDDTLLRALHEAQLLSAVRHPGVIALYDLSGELPDEPGGQGGPPRLAMELCRGGSLRARLQKGPLRVGAALRRAGELLDTLVAVHQTGVVHGDIKPENLLFRGPDLYRGELGPDEAQLGDLVLSDFGLARLGEPEGKLAPALGTFGYAAPEQLTGAGAELGSDLYSAAVVLVEMLTGELAPSRTAVLHHSSSLAWLETARWTTVAAALGSRAPALRALLGELLSPQPTLRPGAAEAQKRLTAITTAFTETSIGSA